MLRGDLFCGYACILEKEGVVINVNKQFTDMTGFTYDELKNRNMENVFKYLRVGSNVDINNIDERIDYFLFNKSLEVKFVNLRVIYEKEEKAYIFVEKPNSNLDVRYPFLNTLCLDGYYGIGIYSILDSTLIKANEKYISFFDEPYNKKENCIGKHIEEFLTGFKGSSYENVWNTVLRTEKSCNIDEYMYEGLNRGVTYWRLSLIPIHEENKLKYCVAMVTEVTGQVLHRKIEEQAKIIEEQKELQKNRLQVIVDNMPDSLMVFDKDGNYILKNKVAESYFTKSSLKKHSDFMIETKYLDLNKNIIPEQNLPYCKTLRTKETDRRILIIKRGSQENYLQTIAVPLLDNKGNIDMVICIATDITEYIGKEQSLGKNRLKLLQAEIEKNKALVKAIDMKDEFLSFISHEFRTPLNVINTAIQAMNYICGNELNEKGKKYLAMIKQNTFRQLRLVNNLLDITRADSERIKINKKNIDIVFLTKAITESVCNYASNKGVTVNFESSAKKKIIGIDDEKYERILLNLLSNAIKFTPGDKCITVSLSSIKGSVCIKVKDNGIGIPPNKIDLIFEKFGQVDSSLSRQAEGTGIGLSLVKRFVEALGGSISVKSKVGVGTTFIMLLPSEKVIEEHNEKEMINLSDNRLIEITSVEFSDIYL